jgi:hypothetical protein
MIISIYVPTHKSTKFRKIIRKNKFKHESVSEFIVRIVLELDKQIKLEVNNVPK